MRFAMGIEYSGSRYFGWQTQPEGGTVQDELQQALQFVANHPVTVQCAGRTDAGVHATAQVVHFDSDAERTERQWILGTNTQLPKDVNVSWVRPVSEAFHARFAALERRYRYVIINREHRSGLLYQRVHFEPRPLDVPLMHEAAQRLVGTHDFSAFRAASCQAKTPVRSLRTIQVHRHGDFVMIDLAADAFLQNMVRIVVGVLLRVGRGEVSGSWVTEVLKSRDRRHRGATVPADGLYLTDVLYPTEFALPSTGAPCTVLPFLTVSL